MSDIGIDVDVIVIGSGIGGGTCARRLTEAGCKVLVLESGPEGEAGAAHHLSHADTPEARLRDGTWPDPVHGEIDGRKSSFYAPLGAGLGGTSVFYAATFERPARHDIDALPDIAHPTGGWPVGWEELAPWYDEVQRLFHVHGEADPLDRRPSPHLRPPPPLTPYDKSLFDHLRGNGLNPYRLHSAVAYLPACEECFGRKCPRNCKMDGRSAGIIPALATGNLRLITGATVSRLITKADQVCAVEYSHGGRLHHARARHVVLAAGAYSSPGLLKASASEDWPQGIGNRHDLVGRKLMFHLSQKFVVWAGKSVVAKPVKSIAFRDLYLVDGERLGMVQSMGVNASYGEILHFLRQRARKSRIIHEGLRIPAKLIETFLGGGALFDGQMEDFPDPDNRLIFSAQAPRRIEFHYATAVEAQQRSKAFKKHIRRALRGKRFMFLTSLPEPNLGHPCGTLGMGDDAASSVTNGYGRIHGMRNLWVGDASVFPSAMAVNPSMTIAALALRQANHILHQLDGASA